MSRKGGKDRGLFFRPRPRGEVLGPTGQRGEWWARYVDQDGREHREKAGTRTAARALYERRKTEVRQGRHFPESLRRRQAVTVRQIADAYLAAIRASRVKTADRIEARLDEALDALGTMAAAAVRPADLERLKATLRSGPRAKARSAASVNRYLQDLKAAFTMAVRDGTLERSPFLGIDLLPENNKRTRELTPREESRLLLAVPAKPPTLRAFYAVALETGARAGELCGLEWQHVLWHDSMAELEETKAGRKQHLVLSARAVAILRELPRQGAFVFAWPDDRPFTVDFVSHAFARAASRADLTDVRLHDLRHTFAIRRRRAGVDLHTIKELLRHASTRMAERYQHVTRDDLRAAMEAGVTQGFESAASTSTARVEDTSPVVAPVLAAEK